MKVLPKSFFEKVRPNVKDLKSTKKNPDDEIIPFNWSKNVLVGKCKDSVIFTLPSAGKRV
jgi:hypothetical protein